MSSFNPIGTLKNNRIEGLWIQLNPGERSVTRRIVCSLEDISLPSWLQRLKRNTAAAWGTRRVNLVPKELKLVRRQGFLEEKSEIRGCTHSMGQPIKGAQQTISVCTVCVSLYVFSLQFLQFLHQCSMTLTLTMQLLCFTLQVMETPKRAVPS